MFMFRFIDSVCGCFSAVHKYSNSNSNSTNSGMISRGLPVAGSVQVLLAFGQSIGTRSATGVCSGPTRAIQDAEIR